MDIAQIRKLIKLVQSSDLTEIEVTEGDQTVRISRQQAAHGMPAAPVYHQQATAVPPAPAAQPEEAAGEKRAASIPSPRRWSAPSTVPRARMPTHS